MEPMTLIRWVLIVAFVILLVIVIKRRTGKS
jgi:hypothetical protein